MRISPPLLLLVLLIFIFTPAIHSWIITGGSAWYRPYIIWFLIISFVFWSQRRHSPDEL